jgi:hypothetical protein
MTGHPLENGAACLSKQTGLFLLLLLVSLSGCGWRQPPRLPGQILGEWKTQEPRHQGRFIKLESNWITFGLGGVAPDRTESIEKLSMEPPNNPTDYVLGLRAADGTDDSIALRFSGDNGGELRMKNQPTLVWRRQGGPNTMLPIETQEAVHDGARPEHKRIYKIDCLRPSHCRSY